MNRFFASFSVLVLTTALAAGCKKEEAKVDDSAAAAPSGAAPSGDQPAPAAGDPAAAQPAADPAAGASAAPSGDFNAEEACTKSIAMLEQMAEAVVANKGNCDAMGDALQKWADSNKAFITQAKVDDNDPAKKKAFEDTCNPKMTPVMEKLGTAMEGAQTCGTNEKVKTALAVLE